MRLKMMQKSMQMEEMFSLSGKQPLTAVKFFTLQ